MRRWTQGGGELCSAQSARGTALDLIALEPILNKPGTARRAREAARMWCVCARARPCLHARRGWPECSCARGRVRARVRLRVSRWRGSVNGGREGGRLRGRLVTLRAIPWRRTGGALPRLQDSRLQRE